MTHRYNNDVKHIKILAKDGCFHIAENKRFRSILVSIYRKREVHKYTSEYIQKTRGSGVY